MNKEYIFVNTLIEIHSSDMNIEEKKKELKKQFGFSDIQCHKCQDIFKYSLPIVYYISYNTHIGTIENNFDYVYHCENLYDAASPAENNARLKEISRLIYMMVTWYMRNKRPAAAGDTLIYEMHTGKKTNGKFTTAMKNRLSESLLKIENYKNLSGSYQNTFTNICAECLVMKMNYISLDKQREEPGTDAFNIRGILLYV